MLVKAHDLLRYLVDKDTLFVQPENVEELLETFHQVYPVLQLMGSIAVVEQLLREPRMIAKNKIQAFYRHLLKQMDGVMVLDEPSIPDSEKWQGTSTDNLVMVVEMDGDEKA